MSTKRLPRNRRVKPDARPPMQLTPRDIQIIRAVNDYRGLLARQIHAIFFGKSPSASHARLIRLFQHGYLNRNFISLFAGTTANTPPIYTVGERGAAVLAEVFGYPSQTIYAPRKAIAWQFAQHLIQINDVRLAVVLATQKQGWGLEKWEDEMVFRRQPDQVSIQTTNGLQAKPVLPDGYFCLTTPQGRAHFFLEVDRGREPEHIFRRKVVIYEAYTQPGGGYQARYSQKSLRILIVTTTARRVETLMRATSKADGDHKYCFTTFPALTPETVLTAPIWQRLDGRHYALVNPESPRVL